ncbi:hypothetical protein HMPREF0731_2733 [Pseudoroseomonas cervicalis ATCC 49957]|uniref:Uncharacterized protein n=1 Tax=Pseudoroseomonas cervicalis ATCC 49957 TaxID=525371 RepID=D5RNS2_9PROT|nr:hypothetical protein HMPREF0731_2733 [Pseudoroseomonas cervicalis ATCC 49957]
MAPAFPPELQAAIAAMQEGLVAPRRAVLDPHQSNGAGRALIPA